MVGGHDQHRLRVPDERKPDQSRLEVRYSPTLAGALVDALPYLADYPYGCTEQTLNRFLPTVITQHVLLSMKLDLKDIEKKRTNLNAQEIGNDKERAKGWKRYPRNPVTDATYDRQTRRWTAHVWSGRAGEIAQGTVVDATGQLLDVRTGPQVAWQMARGGRATFGGAILDRPFVWYGLCAVFLLGLADLRRLWSLRNLDLAVLLSFCVSLELFVR